MFCVQIPCSLMFDRYYKFNLVDKKATPRSDVLCTWRYNFKTHIRRYIAVVEQYKNDIFIIKYYADCHSRSRYKFSYIFNDEKPPRIIRTCINIMLDFYKNYPEASFGFIGAYSSNKKTNGVRVTESKSNTQRYRIYKTLMYNFFGKESFAHSTNRKYSGYLIINREKGSIRVFKKNAEKLFSKLYVELNFP